MALEGSDEIISRIPFMEKHGLMQLFRQFNKAGKIKLLVFLFGIHVVVVEAGFPNGDNAVITRDNLPDFVYISKRRFIGCMGMNTCCTVGVMGFDKVRDQTVFPCF